MKQAVVLFTFVVMLVFGITMAQAITISPILNIVENGKNKTEITLMDDDKFYEIKVYKWTQDEKGKAVWSETDDIIVYPSVAKAPKAIKLIAKNKNRDKEMAYRVVLTAIVPENDKTVMIDKDGKMSGLNITLQFDVPLFLAAKTKEGEVKTECTATARFYPLRDENASVESRWDANGIKVTNNSTQFVKFKGAKNVYYVLAGNTVTIAEKKIIGNGGNVEFGKEFGCE